MEQIVNYFDVEYRKDLWPILLEKFKGNFSKQSVLFFKIRGESEDEFVRFSREHGLQIRRKHFIEYDGKGPANQHFFYLSVRDTREFNDDFIQRGCDGGGNKRLCWTGAKQIRKVSVSPQISSDVARFDILVKNYPIRPRVFLISRKLRSLIIENQFSGCEFIPCLQLGRAYAEEQLSIETLSEDLGDQTEVFQLVITSPTKSPPNVGHLFKSTQCPKCGALGIVDGEKTQFFQKDDLLQLDFQYFDSIFTENRGVLNLMGPTTIISKKVLRLLLDHKIKGLKPFLADPPIKHAAVEIE